MQVLIIGYYHRKNFGDDLFEYCFKNILLKQEKYQLHFLNFDDLKTLTQTSIKQYSIIIIGGGDLVNEYYFSPSNVKLFEYTEAPIYFVSTGITFENTLNLIDLGDYFFMRNNIDAKRLQKRYGIEYTHFIPDLGFTLGLELHNNPNFDKTLLTNKSLGIQKIGISLPYTWLAENSSYERILDNIVHTLTALAMTFELVFIPFDIGENILNSDLLFIQELERRTTSIQHRITYIKEKEWTPAKMVDVYQSVDAIIGSRYHSVIMAILCEKPFISLYSTTKLSELKNDFPDLEHLFIPIEKDINLNPIKVNMNQVLFALQSMIFNYKDYVERIQKLKINIFKHLNEFVIDFGKLIESKSIRTTPPSMLSKEKQFNILNSTINKVLNRIYDHTSINDVDRILKGEPLINILPKPFHNDNTRRIVTEETLWLICEDPYGPYYYGLFEKIFTNNFIDQVNWIIENYYQHLKVHSHHNKSSIKIINKNFQEVHRSGWQLVVNELLTEFDKNVKNDIIVDTYIDKTFHWNKYFYKHKAIIPYTKPWIGFIHHTFNDYNNNFNCHELLKNDLFLSSLQHCNCLIVMSHCLKKELDKSFLSMKMYVPITVIYHPTDFDVIPFQWSNFIINKQRKVIQVGNWLRNMYSIYTLQLPKTSIVTQKAILKNKNSEHYFAPDTFFESFLGNYLSSDNQNVSNVYDMCKITFDNQYIKGMYHHLISNHKSVQVIPHLANHQYDLLLSENIVFLHLIDASAVNTIIECIVRHTPIIINKIDPIVEILGENYPLYYNSDDLFQASCLLNSSSKLLEGHLYLQNMDKTSLTIEHFKTQMTHVLNTYIN